MLAKGIVMETSLVQFHIDETVKLMAVSICEKLGMDLQTYLRMCMLRLIEANGIPFSIKLEDTSENRGLRAMRVASRIAVENGIDDMTLDEVNAEINAVRE